MRDVALVAIAVILFASCGQRLNVEARFARSEADAAAVVRDAAAATPGLGNFDVELAANSIDGVAYTSAAALPVSWSDSENAVSYWLRVGRDAACKDVVHERTAAASTTSLELPELADGA